MLCDLTRVWISHLDSNERRWTVAAGKAGKVHQQFEQPCFQHPYHSRTVGGLTCYGLGAIAYILLLTRVKLSIAGPAICSSLRILSPAGLLCVSGIGSF